MNRMIFKKINLLLHLAKIDGKFDKSEEKLLLDVLKENGLNESYLSEHKQEAIDLDSFHKLPDRTELFYWVLRMIKADNYLHPDEIAYSKAIALKLKIKSEAVDYFISKEIPALADFEATMKQFHLS